MLGNLSKALGHHFGLPAWLVEKADEHELQAMLQTRGISELLDPVVERKVQRVLLAMRWKRAITPYLQIFSFAGEIIRGQYRRAFAKIHSDPDTPSSGSAGAGTTPIAQFTGYGGGFSAPGTTTGFSGAGALGSTISDTRPIPDGGIKAGEIVGYRCWRLHNGKLYSMYQSAFCWEPGKTIEGDVTTGDGVHAFKNPLAVGHYGYSDRSEATVVSGTVWLWGEVVEHQEGYRASKAAIRSIDSSPLYDASKLRKLYRVTRVRKKKQNG